MNKLLIMCFVLSMEIFVSILPHQNLDISKDEYYNCRNQKDKTKCSTVHFTTKNFQCCYFKIETQSEEGSTPSSEELCNLMINPIKPGLEEKETENGKMMAKEYIGFMMLKNSYFSSMELNFTCPDGNLVHKAETKDFTEEEKTRFKSDNLCLQLFEKSYKGGTTDKDKETCYNGILSTAENSKINCGYFEFKLSYINGTTGDFKTCYLFNEDIPKTKNMGFWTKYLLEVALSNLKGEISNYLLNATNSKNQYFVYDSSKDLIIDSSDAKFLSIKYLLLIILVLI